MLDIPENFNGITTDSALVGKWVAEKTGGRYTDGATGIGIIKDGKLAVGVMYESFTGEGGSILMHSRCDNPKATTRWFYWAIFDYPFNQLGAKRCNVIVHEGNTHAIKLNKKLGFVGDTVIKDYFPTGNAVLLAMYKEDCKWLKESRHDKKLVTRNTQ